jgi:predicted acetyltransferase
MKGLADGSFSTIPACEDSDIVGAVGSFPFELTVPGGRVSAAGVTIVAVLPTHRRRGILRRLMRAPLDACRERGEPVAYLWATEDTIYDRFGMGWRPSPRTSTFNVIDPSSTRPPNAQFVPRSYP